MMRVRFSKGAGAHLIWAFLSFCILLICIFYIKYEYDYHIYPDKLAHDTFQPIACEIIDKKLSLSDDSAPRYRADFLISYQVNDVQYNYWVSGNGFDRSFYRDKAKQDSILNTYQIGKNYSCFVDPKDPQIAILNLRYNWFSTIPLIIPVVIGLIALVFLIKNIFLFFSHLKS